ncbi:hypothetical protein [Nocardia carnea]|uniref:hypothetical protein n=1 Tax=Nocardia carnea TaxID=37328 RepID=UPI002457726E|nr:hypothetical protein [Nocardia carnea]
MTAIPFGSDLDITGRTLKGHRDGWQVYQSFTVHAVGAGQLDLGLWIPYDCTITALRYRCAVLGSGGGSAAVELRLNGIDGANTIAGTSFAPALTPAWNAVNVNLAEDDMLWPWMTSFHTEPGAQLRMEAKVVRR